MEWTAEMSAEEGRRMRARHAPETAPASEFEGWALANVKIKHKRLLTYAPFRLNRAQRKVVAALEEQRRRGLPQRVIVLKSRQWGCSTVIAYYMMWLQLHGEQLRHSLVCAHTKSTASVIGGNYADLVAFLPAEEKMKLKRYENTDSTRVLLPGGSRITITSAQNPDAARGADYTMAHLSEVAFWPATPTRTPQMLVRSVVASVPRIPESFIVMESTANGPGDFFHTEWKRSAEGKSGMTPVFAGWTDDDNCSEPLIYSEEDTWAELDDYERELWTREGCTLEQVWWYHCKRQELGDCEMLREYPTTPGEAFSHMRGAVFDQKTVEAQRANVCPAARRCDVNLPSGEWIDSPGGPLEVWAEPCKREDVSSSPAYVIAVDVGGNWPGADWSVISVFDVREPGRMELVAQWRGHTYIDRLCQTALALGRSYHDALLVFESNSLDSRGADALERVGASGYPNLFRRYQTDKATGLQSWHYGFHTNRSTKPTAINDLAIALRDGALIERCGGAVEEMTTYLRTANGGYEAAPGCHDDMVMTRAIAAYALRQNPPRQVRSYDSLLRRR